MILVGAWVALIGYGVMYAGINKLGGGSCGLRQAFSIAGCQGGSGNAPTVPGATSADRAAAADLQQQATIPQTVLV
jgi:hypothetical protein